MLKKVKIGIGVILLVVAVIIAFQNRESVETRLLFVTVEMPRAALLFVTLVTGFGAGVLTTWSIISKSKEKNDASS